jgi:membrane fusion protein (multidrug efflux system)
MRTWVILLIVAAAIGGIVYYNKVLSQPKQEASKPSAQAPVIPINGFIARSQQVGDRVVASGTLVASEQVDLHPEASGRITYLNLSEGKQVSKGALLVKLYDADLQAQLKKLQVQKENQEKIVERSRKLLEADNISQQDLDLATTQLNALLSDIDLIRSQITKTEVRAPFEGMLGLRSISMGAYITPANTIARLQQVNPLKIDFFVPEKYSNAVREGQEVFFEVDGFEEKFKGRIYAIEPDIDLATRSLKIRALVNNPSTRLYPGAFAKVSLDVKDIPAVLIPTQAIIPQARGKKVIIAKNGKAVFADVKTGLRTENNVQVTSGVSEGDTVVTTGIMFIKPDQSLRFVKVEE